VCVCVCVCVCGICAVPNDAQRSTILLGGLIQLIVRSASAVEYIYSLTQWVFPRRRSTETRCEYGRWCRRRTCSGRRCCEDRGRGSSET